MEDRNIIEWGIIDIREEGNPKKKDINKIGPILIEKMMAFDKLINVDYILIENQPVLKNPVMKSIQMILFAYYVKNYEFRVQIYPYENKIRLDSA